jgi:hypothetical protein
MTLPAVKPPMLVPVNARLGAEVKADRVVKVPLLVAVMLAASPAILPVTCEPGRDKADSVVRVLFVVAVRVVAVSVPVMSPVSVPTSVSAGVVVGLATVPVKPFALTKLNEVTEPPASVFEIVSVPDPAAMLIPDPAMRVRAPV